MKKICILLIISLLLCCFGCDQSIKEYAEVNITRLSYTQVNYNGGYTTEYIFDFEGNTATKHSFIPGDENGKLETIAEFTDEQEEVLINKLYTYGLFDIKKEYKATNGIVDGGGWDLKIDFIDGTSKSSSGSNNSPTTVFSNCAKAFYDICRNGVVGLVPQEYYQPPNVSYAFRSSEGEHSYSPYSERVNYKWNGFEETNNVYILNETVSFAHTFTTETAYELVLYTANYENYEKFNKCIVTSYNYDEQLSGEKIVFEDGWFKQVEFDLELDKIYLIKFIFTDGDFAEYTFNTKVSD